jgi:hypothetical protein
MTRLTPAQQKNAIAAIRDIIEMDELHEPEGSDVDSFLRSFGTHGSLAGDVAVYSGNELHHVHTKKVGKLPGNL